LELGDRYWLCNVVLTAEHYDGDHVVKTVGYCVYQHDDSIRQWKWVGAKPIEPEVPILCVGQVNYRMRWSLPVVDDYDDTEAPASYLERHGRLAIASLDVPGIHPPHIAEWMAEYLALKQVEAWAVEHGPRPPLCPF